MTRDASSSAIAAVATSASTTDVACSGTAHISCAVSGASFTPKPSEVPTTSATLAPNHHLVRERTTSPPLLAPLPQMDYLQHPTRPARVRTSQPTPGSIQLEDATFVVPSLEAQQVHTGEASDAPVPPSTLVHRRTQLLAAMGDPHALLRTTDWGIQTAKALMRTLRDAEEDTIIHDEQLRKHTTREVLSLNTTTGVLPPAPTPRRRTQSFDRNLDPAANPKCTDTAPLITTRDDGLSRDGCEHTSTSITAHFGYDPRQCIYTMPKVPSGCLRAQLRVSHRSAAEPITIRAVIDSGASWTAVRLSEMHRLGIHRFNPSAMRFHGVTNTPLKVLGWCELHLTFGKVHFRTVAFVFESLSEPMLLGTNTLRSQGLVIDAKNMALYHGEQRSLPPDAVPLTVGNSSELCATWTADVEVEPACFYRAGRELWCTNGTSNAVYHLGAALPREHRTRRRRLPARPPSSMGGSEPDSSGKTDSRKVSFDPAITGDHEIAGDTSESETETTDTILPLDELTLKERKPRLGRGGSTRANESFREKHDDILGRGEAKPESAEGTEVKFSPLAAMEESDPERRAEIRRDRLQALSFIPPDLTNPRDLDPELTRATVAKDIKVAPGETEVVLLKYDHDIAGPNISLALEPTHEFALAFPECHLLDIDPQTGTNLYAVQAIHQSRNRYAFYKLANFTDETVSIAKGTPLARVTKHYDPAAEAFHLEHGDLNAEVLLTACGDPIVDAAVDDGEELPPAYHASDTSPDANITEFEGLGSTTIRIDVADLEYHQRSFEKGGPATKLEHLTEMGLDLTQCCDTGIIGCPALTLEDGSLQPVVDACLRGERVWSRKAKTPDPATHPACIVKIPTGDVQPIRQKPYPIPRKYVEAVRAEVEGLLRANLIEPGCGDWCSPVLCIVKKDSAEQATGTDIKLKIAVDYRRLNAVTQVDAGLLGDQADILEMFNGRPYASLCDAAGGFYQFTIDPVDRPKTSFVLPFSAGGTVFQWRVAPYGLTNMPAVYSRAMMHVLRGLHDAPLGYAMSADDEVDPTRSLGTGTASSWVDDITIATGGASPGCGVQGHCRMLEMVFDRLAAAGLTLKPSKAHILREKLEVLGFRVTPEGLRVHEDKIKALQKMPDRLSNPKEVLRFLGMINFNRRFIFRLSHTADPLFALLKKDVPRGDEWPWTEQCAKAYKQLREALCEDALLSHPDLSDPRAEFAIMTDASDVAAGGVLMQWQRPHGTRLSPDATPEPAVSCKDPFLKQHAARRRDGYVLKTIGYFSKTFNDVQRRWAIFDKEASAILLACHTWHRLIVGHPTTVYTDNTVAASILSNHHHPRPPRLQRWGIELGTYLPHLRIAYRQGDANYVADHMSRYPCELTYHPTGEDEVVLDDDLYSKLVSFSLGFKRYTLTEAREEQLVQEIWAAQDACPPQQLNALERTRSEQGGIDTETFQCIAEECGLPPSLTADPSAGLHALLHGPPLAISEPRGDSSHLSHLMAAFAKSVGTPREPDFDGERQHANEELDHWDRYVQIFMATHGRPPVIYDLFCGEGCFARGAAVAGCIVVGFDNQPRPLTYGMLPVSRLSNGHFERRPIEGMYYIEQDLSDEGFWQDMLENGCATGQPKPDLIHASPPCSAYTALRHLPRANSPALDLLEPTLRRLDDYQNARVSVDGTYVPWSVENVGGAAELMGCLTPYLTTLCGTMFGHQVFRHRLIASSDPLHFDLQCSHQGKGVGERGPARKDAHGQDRYARYTGPTNMYGPYSWAHSSRGSLTQLTKAMGFEEGSFTYPGLKQGLPAGYGHLIAAQLTVTSLVRNVGVPRVSFQDIRRVPLYDELLSLWCQTGYSGPEISFGTNTLDGDHASTIAARSIQRWARLYLTRHPRAPRVAVSQIETAVPSTPWQVPRDAQLRDPQLKMIFESLEASVADRRSWSAKRRSLGEHHRHDYHLVDGRLFRSTTQGPRLVVPTMLQRDLLIASHRSADAAGHRGADALYDYLARRYFWVGLYGSCKSTVWHCEVCRGSDTRRLPRIHAEAKRDPPHPFHTIHIDHKDLPQSGTSAYKYLLLVVCALTRFCIAIPTETTSAEETCRALQTHVFNLFSYPVRLISDNARGFDSNLMDEFSKFAGFRAMKVLPNNPQSNGSAEQTVDRVSRLLGRHCRKMAEWHKSVPMVCHALNCSVHSGTFLSPFFALFGRHPIGIPELEESSLMKATTTGAEFVTSLSHRMHAAWAEVRRVSRELKLEHIAQNEKYRQRWASRAMPLNLNGISVGDRVLVRHGDQHHAARLRKHGEAALRSFRVVRLIPESQALEIDTRNTGMRPVVSLRHCIKAPQTWWIFDDASPGAGQASGPTTVAAARGEVATQLADDIDSSIRLGRIYEVDRVAEAKKVGKVWWYRIFWVNYTASTWERSSTLRDAGADVQAEMITARERYNSANKVQPEVPPSSTSADNDGGGTAIQPEVRGQADAADEADEAEGNVSSRTRSSRRRRSAAISSLDDELPSLTSRHSWYETWLCTDDIDSLEIVEQ